MSDESEPFQDTGDQTPPERPRSPELVDFEDAEVKQFDPSDDELSPTNAELSPSNNDPSPSNNDATPAAGEEEAVEESVDSVTQTQSSSVAEAVTEPDTPETEERPTPKHRRLRKHGSASREASNNASQEKEQQVDNIKIPKKKKAQRKKGASKKTEDQDGDFVPSADDFSKNHLDADYYDDDEVEERKIPKKKAPSAGKLYFDEVLKRVKERKKKNVQITTEECQHYCRQLIDKMIAAATADVEAVQQGKTGLNKLKMLNDISEFSKPAWRNWCIAEGGAVALASWIAPLPDGSLPTLSVRTKVLQIALQLPFQSTDLRDNDLGRHVVALWKHPDECDSNRVLIRAIVQKWVRPMLGLASNYADMQQDFSVGMKSSMLSMEGDDKDRKQLQKFSQHKNEMGSIIVNQERINSKLTQMFRVIEARRKTPSKATKVNMDGALI
ncbi:IWS1 C-terminus domain containing protein [Babesia ovata]|uniref:IWS1 C-terminus domain containing protein n=1 Tax=Babesia ovata TaxID=189622 RepID=A0A2H6KF08_9APIC|nr:IWS1 C-terminus domain containing protein [Babesia ovata]GBE61575.1 IWS1 C-terminus domain containing protein [Babesia ovata]